MAELFGFPVPGSETPTSTPIVRHKEALLAGFKPRIDSNKATVLEHYRENVQRYWDRPFLGSRLRSATGELGAYEWKTWREVDALVLSLAAGLQALGLAGSSQGSPAHPTLGLMSPGCEEWVLVDLACQRQTITLVPLGEKVKLEDLLYMVEQTGLRTIACPIVCLNTLIRRKLSGASSLRKAILWETEAPAELAQKHKL